MKEGFALKKLNADLQFEILSHLETLKDINNISLSCKLLNERANHASFFWQKMCIREDIPFTPTDMDYKKLYKSSTLHTNKQYYTLSESDLRTATFRYVGFGLRGSAYPALIYPDEKTILNSFPKTNVITLFTKKEDAISFALPKRRLMRESGLYEFSFAIFTVTFNQCRKIELKKTLKNNEEISYFNMNPNGINIISARLTDFYDEREEIDLQNTNKESTLSRCCIV